MESMYKEHQRRQRPHCVSNALKQGELENSPELPEKEDRKKEVRKKKEERRNTKEKRKKKEERRKKKEVRRKRKEERRKE